MMPLLRCAFALAMAACGIAAAALLPRGLDTDLYSLVGGDGALVSLGRKTSGMVRVLCADSARAAKCREAFRFDPPLDPAAFMETVRTHGRGLLAAKSRGLLERGELDRLRRGVKRRDYSGVGLFPKSDDPNYFLSDFVAELTALQPQELPEGAEILTGTFQGDADGEKGLRRLVGLAEEDDGIWLSGAPFHSLMATDRTKSEVGVLGALSFAAVLAFGWSLFRCFGFVLPTALALASGFLAGTAAACLLPGRPHALTFLFGTTLIGLGVDYCYHALGEVHDGRFARKLASALATTCLSFSPLLLSSVCVLRQMAVFTIAGLVAAFAYAMLFIRPVRVFADPPSAALLPRRGLMAAAALLLAVVATAAVRGVRFSSDPSLFHRPEPVMARGEAKFAELTSGSGSFVAVPLARWQEGNAALKAKVEEPRGEFLSASDLPPWLVVEVDGEDCLFLPEDAARSVVGEGIGTRIDLRASLAGLFEGLSSETHRLLAAAFAVFAFAMAALFGRRAPAVAWPVCAAVLLTFATLAALGASVTFFHSLCFFMLVGLGVDYAIFRTRIVKYGFLTSFVGFGLLSLTSFPVTRFMGVTLALGLLYAYLFARLRGAE